MGIVTATQPIRTQQSFYFNLCLSANSLKQAYFKHEPRSKIIAQFDNRYSKFSQGPFIIYVEFKNDGSSLSSLHPLAMARKLNSAGIDHLKAQRRGPNRIQLTFDNCTSANTVVTTKKNDKLYLYKPDYKVYIV